MISKHKKHYETLKRRRDRLHERLSEDFVGNSEPTKREMAALSWAISIVEALDRQDILWQVAP